MTSYIGAIMDPAFNFDDYVKRVRKVVNKCKYILNKEPLKEAVLVSRILYGL